MRHTTITDIARQLQLSPSTVSRALRGHPDISRATRERVLDLAAATNYQPNLIAQSLQTRRSNNIGVIVPEIRNTFFSTVISGIEEVAYEAGYTIMVCQSNDSYEREVINTRALAANRVAGLLVSTSQETSDFEHIRRLVQQGLPVVLFDRVAENLAVSKVIVDDFEGAYNAVSFLIKTGRRRIAHLAGSPTLYVSRKRSEGYQAALRDHGLAMPDGYLLNGGCHEEDGRLGMQHLLGQLQRPDAVFCINDPVAIGAFLHLREQGIAVPGEIALIGFSNNPNTALMTPRLTTVNQPAFEIGRQAARLLLKNFPAGSTMQAIETIILKTELIVREST